MYVTENSNLLVNVATAILSLEVSVLPLSHHRSTQLLNMKLNKEKSRYTKYSIHIVIKEKQTLEIFQ